MFDILPEWTRKNCWNPFITTQLNNKTCSIVLKQMMDILMAGMHALAVFDSVFNFEHKHLHLGIQEMFRQKLEQATISYFTTFQANEKLMIDPRGKFKRKCDVLFKNKFVLMVFNIMNNVLSHCDCSEVHSRLVQWQIHSSQFPGEGRRRI